LFAFAVAACGRPGDDATKLAVTVDTLGDTVRTHIHHGSVWGDTAHLVPVLTFGTADGPEEFLFGNIRSLAVAPTGEIYLMDGQVPALRKYAADGRYLMTLGRKGSGPGEYRQPDGGVAVVSDGRVVLRDPGNARLAVYSGDGSYLTQWPVTAGFNTGRPLYHSRDDQLYTLVLLDNSVPVWEWVYGLRHYATDGTTVDTLTVPAWDYQRATVRGQSENNSSTEDVPFTPTAPWTFSPDGYVVSGIGGEYSFTLFRPDGPHQVIKTSTPVPVQDAEGAEQQALATWYMVNNFPGWTWNGPPVPSTKPAFTELFVGEDGRIWVQVSTPGRLSDQPAAPPDTTRPPELRYTAPVAFDVFESDGTYLGHVTTPDGFEIYPKPVFRGDTVWAVTTDPTEGFPQVARYVVTHAAP
jgi:hypothetical protein